MKRETRTGETERTPGSARSFASTLSGSNVVDVNGPIAFCDTTHSSAWNALIVRETSLTKLALIPVRTTASAKTESGRAHTDQKAAPTL